MSIVTMDMSDYTVERDDSMDASYGKRTICADMSPSLALQQHVLTGENHPAAIPLDLVAADVGLFLEKMYAYRR